MAKPCPKHTANDPHTTKEVSLGPTLSYSLCEKCKEDVDFIARGMNLQWNEANKGYEPIQAQRPNVNPNAQNDFDDEDEDADGFNPAVNPPNWNPRPVRNMGQGNRHIILQNDDNSAAHLVMEVLRRVFQKDPMEANYIMQDAHYQGRAKVFQCADDAEAQRYLDAIDLAKTDIANSGAVGADTIQNLQFIVEVVN